ncbi:MAG: 4Fe-4S binding protein [Pseudomonadota bacterium]
MPGVPNINQVIMLRLDTRLGFDPGSPHEFHFRAVRDHGMFMPERGTHDLTLAITPPEDFFVAPQDIVSRPVWLEVILERWYDLIILGIFVVGLFWLLLRRQRALSNHPQFFWNRLACLVVITGFVGWYGQGQLSIVTPLASIGALVDSGSFLFLLYDPFSLLLWLFVLVSLLVFGRGFFCGWLCPYGALQEISARTGRALNLPQWRLPDRLDRLLRYRKDGVLILLVVATLTNPQLADGFVEIEP